VTIADWIERDLAHRIRAGARLPEPWSIVGIAAEYDVSATPVRRALAGLEEAGLVRRLDNGRFEPRRGRRRAGSAPERPESFVDVLSREVLMMGLRGESGFVREEALAERFGVGRTRLRRGLHRLAGGGLIEHVPRRGWRVRPFSHDDVRSFIDVRATLEVQALDLARGRLEPDVLERIVRGNGPGAVDREALDNSLHAYFVERSRNHYIAAFFETHGRYHMTLFDHATVDAAAVDEMAGQHVEILQHCLAGRWERAKAALEAHIHAQVPVLGAVVERLEASAHGAA